VAANKMDTLHGKEQIDQAMSALQASLPPAFPLFRISAKGQQGFDPLKAALKDKLPESPAYFPTDQLTDKWERFYVAELIREQLFGLFQEEVPHATAVVIEEFREQAGRKDVIKAVLHTETEGQKKILIGNKGVSIKTIGQKARKEIEEKLGRPVFLEMTVKTTKNWRNNPEFLKKVQGDGYF